MPLTRSKVKQSLQHPSTSSSVSIEENIVALGRRSGRRPKNGPCPDENINPLLNNVVLATLFEFVEEKDMKTCRLVCNQWNHVTLPIVRSKFQVGISDSGEQGIEGFMKVIDSNTLGIPFGRYSLGFIDTTKRLGQQFLRTCGNSAQEIIIDMGSTQTIENVAKILKSAPKLESFTIPLYYVGSINGKVVELFPGPENTKPKLPSLKYFKIQGPAPKEKNLICPTFYDEFFRAAENISTLDLYFGGSRVCLEVLETIEKLGRESMITNMKFSEVNGKHLDILRRMSVKEKGLKLKRLDWTDHGYDRDFIFFELVELFKNSLIALRYTFYHSSYRDSNWIAFPHMPKTKRLHLRPYTSHRLNCENFGNTFPSLETLHIDFNNVYDQHDYSTPHPAAYKFERRTFAHIEIENLDGMLTTFPTLRFLQCAIPEEDLDQVMRTICTQMTQLEGLGISTMFYYGNMDSLLTGIPVQEFTKLGNMDKFFNSLPKLGISNRETKIQNALTMMTKNSEVPSIRDLTNLRSLTIQHSTTTDFTAYFGLYFLKNLRHLKLTNCRLSKSCCEVLVKDKKLSTWEFTSICDVKIIPMGWNYRTVPDYLKGF